MTKKNETIWFALNPYDAYDKENKVYLGRLYSVSFAGVTWDCDSNYYLSFSLNLKSKESPLSLSIGNIDFIPLRVELDEEDNSLEVEFNFSDSADFLNFLIYNYEDKLKKMEIEADDDEPLFEYKLYNKGKNKNALKHIEDRISKREYITDADMLNLIKMNVL